MSDDKKKTKAADIHECCQYEKKGIDDGHRKSLSKG